MTRRVTFATLMLLFVITFLSGAKYGMHRERENTEKCLVMRMQKQVPASASGWVLVQAWVKQDEVPKAWVPK